MRAVEDAIDPIVLVFRLSPAQNVGLKEKVEEKNQVGDVHEDCEGKHARLQIAFYTFRENQVAEMNEKHNTDDKLPYLDGGYEFGDATWHSEPHRAKEIITKFTFCYF